MRRILVDKPINLEEFKMATVTKVHGVLGEAPMDQLGRSIEWVLVTTAVDAATADVARLALEQVASITIQGAPNGDGTVFGCEGVGTLPANSSIVALTGNAYA